MMIKCAPQEMIAKTHGVRLREERSIKTYKTMIKSERKERKKTKPNRAGEKEQTIQVQIKKKTVNNKAK